MGLAYKKTREDLLKSLWPTYFGTHIRRYGATWRSTILKGNLGSLVFTPCT